MGFNKPVTDHHKRQHYLPQFGGFESNGQQIMKFLIVFGNQLSPSGIANTIEIVVAAVNA